MHPFEGGIITLPERVPVQRVVTLRLWVVLLLSSIAGLAIAFGVSSGTHPVKQGDSQARAALAAGSEERAGVKPALDSADEFGDGTPDFLRLRDAADQLAFRGWFAFLAESTYFQKEQDRPVEVEDCAALIRFAYREALRRHDGYWAETLHLSTLPQVGSVQKYNYPHTAIGAGLFRVRYGAFMPQDVSNGTFAEFADAETLLRYNTHRVSRDISAAQAGDLLFFRQAGHRMPFHSMIYLGRSQFTGSDENWLVYHTGPDHDRPHEGRAGEIRRVSVPDLLRHPETRWRPSPQNSSFLGVYRWNILREAK